MATVWEEVHLPWAEGPSANSVSQSESVRYAWWLVVHELCDTRQAEACVFVFVYAISHQQNSVQWVQRGCGTHPCYTAVVGYWGRY